MNIFNVLSQGKGNLNEENLSAMLAYLLSPNGSHGLEDVFLKRFLEFIMSQNEDTKKILNYILSGVGKIKAQVLLENGYKVNNKPVYPDIDIRLFNHHLKGSNKNEYCRIIIENKIKVSTANEQQLELEYEAIRKSINENVKIIMVFLTPESEKSSLKNEFQILKKENLKKDQKVWLNWKNKKNEDVVSILKSVLKSEDDFKIDPISNYVRYTIKAFIRHIIENNNVEGIEEVVSVSLSSGNYRIEKYLNSAVKVFNLDLGKYEQNTKSILKKINSEMNLNIDLYHKTGTEVNTRFLGKKIIKELKIN